jgi:hypothetical protein
MLSAATATATVLTVGVAPPPHAVGAAAVNSEAVDLAAAVKIFPAPGVLPDLTGGAGSAVYDAAQAFYAQALTAIVNNANLSALAQASGVDLESLLAQIPAALLPGVLQAVEVPLGPLLGGVLTQVLGSSGLNPLVAAALTTALTTLGVIDTSGSANLLDVLGLLGLDLSDPLNVSNLNVPGLNIVTAGAPFTLLKLLGVDLGWVPPTPNSVADEINGTSYLKVGLVGLLGTLSDALGTQNLPLTGVIDTLTGALTGLGVDVPDLVDIRVPITVGFGLGAFALGAAYPQVVADLPNQPGGSAYTGVDPILGSFTILPMILLRNPGRANGGLFARFYPLGDLVGIDLVTPDTHVESDGKPGDVALPGGLLLGGANLIPIKIDATVEYDPLSDFAAWPNPFTLANNLAAGAFPTYILRGLTLDTVPAQITSQLNTILGGLVTNPNSPLALNLYLTIPSSTLPLLEPVYLIGDVSSLAGVDLPYKVANALSPALTSLVNLGYTDAYRTPSGAYDRTLLDAGDPTPFFSFPDVDWTKVPQDVLNQLFAGIQKEFLSGNPTPPPVNVVSTLIGLIGGGATPFTAAPIAGGTSPGTSNPGGLFDGLGNVFSGVGNLGSALPGGLVGGAAGGPTSGVAGLLHNPLSSVLGGGTAGATSAGTSGGTTGNPVNNLVHGLPVVSGLLGGGGNQRTSAASVPSTTPNLLSLGNRGAGTQAATNGRALATAIHDVTTKFVPQVKAGGGSATNGSATQGPLRKLLSGAGIGQPGDGPISKALHKLAGDDDK